jgi:hypothetical protein
MIKQKYIVAGTYEQYRQFLYNHKDDINIEYIYVQSAMQLRGLSNIEGFLIGTYHKRPDIVAIMDTIRIIKSKRNQQEYSVENYFDIGNGRYIAKKDYVETYVPAENAVYGNVTGYKRTAEQYQQLLDNSMIDSMRD